MRLRDLEGRTNRIGFLGYFVGANLASGVVGALLALVSTFAGLELLGFYLVAAVAFAFGLFVAAAAIRRLHDLGLSAWWLVCAFVPGLNLLVILGLLVLPGAKIENRFGPAQTTSSSPQAGGTAIGAGSVAFAVLLATVLSVGPGVIARMNAAAHVKTHLRAPEDARVRILGVVRDQDETIACGFVNGRARNGAYQGAQPFAAVVDGEQASRVYIMPDATAISVPEFSILREGSDAGEPFGSACVCAELFQNPEFCVRSEQRERQFQNWLRAVRRRES